MRFELHCHSTCSDGTEAPERVAARAAERAVEVFALTDHDTCVGSAVTVPNARVLRAVEISCDHKGRTIHVLAFDRGGTGWAALEERITTVRLARVNRIRTMAARLEQRGVRLDVDPLIAEGAERSIGRPDLARLMVANGHATSMKDAFSRHLFDGGPVDVPNKALSMADAIAAGREANAAMSLAHPHLYDSMSFEMVREYELGGIEAFYGRYDARERKRWIELADERGLVCTGGSDWHGPEDSDVQPGVDLPADRSDALLRWLS
jgi:predicted metal-dependent phosphoesterase TrpH